MLAKEDDINKKIQMVKEILDRVFEILILFKSVIKDVKTKDIYENKDLEKAAYLFGEISELCKEIENNSLPSETFFDKLAN